MRRQYIAHQHICGFAIFLCILIATTLAFGTENSAENLPSALWPEARFEFKPVVAGVDVTHSFIVKNNGSALLLIESVKAG